jgi:hypothetical protein
MRSGRISRSPDAACFSDTATGMRDLRSYIEAIRDLPLEEKVTDKILAGTSPESLKLS